MYWIHCLLMLVSVLMNSVQVKSQGVCTGMTPCFCQYENGQFLDISSLGRTDGEPRFVNVTDSHEIEYSWNPCFNFTEGECNDVALCSIEPSIPHNIYKTLGLQNGYNFIINSSENSITLQYTANKRKAHIKLICTTGDLNSTYFNAIGPAYQDSPDYVLYRDYNLLSSFLYNQWGIGFFELRSPLCCPQGTPKVTTRRPTTSKPDSTIPNKSLEGALIVVSILAAGLAAGLLIAVLKIKGKICIKPSYDEL